MAIDYGMKRVGLAVTDPLQMIATGLATVAAKEVIGFLKTYTGKENVDCFVVGEPKTLGNKPTHASVPVENFIKDLRKNFSEIPVYTIDERFTSKMASQALVSGGVKKKDRQNKELIDTTSATIILQSFLEQRESREAGR